MYVCTRGCRCAAGPMLQGVIATSLGPEVKGEEGEVMLCRDDWHSPERGKKKGMPNYVEGKKKGCTSVQMGMVTKEGQKNVCRSVCVCK